MLADEVQEEVAVASTPAAFSVPSAAVPRPVTPLPAPASGYVPAVAPPPPLYPGAAPYPSQYAHLPLHPQTGVGTIFPQFSNKG